MKALFHRPRILQIETTSYCENYDRKDIGQAVSATRYTQAQVCGTVRVSVLEKISNDRSLRYATKSSNPQQDPKTRINERAQKTSRKW